MKAHFYCQNLCGEVDFDINEWNKALKYCNDTGLSQEQRDAILNPPACKEQCDACINIVLDTRARNKEKYGW